MKRLLIIIVLLSNVCLAQTTRFNLTQLPRGTTAGQLMQSNGSSADPSYVDPIVSYNYANLLNAQAATAIATGSAVRLSTFSGFGTLYLTFASITGSPAGCTVQLKNFDSLGNSLNNGAAIAVTPANGTTSIVVSSALALQTAAQISATYNCATFPTAGTVSVDYVPGIAVGIMSMPSVNQGTAAAVASAWPVKITDGTNSVIIDPCQSVTRSSANISAAASATVITGTALKQTYICSLNLVTATAQNIALVEGTGTACATGPAGMAGGATAATGWNFGANGGLVIGVGSNWVFKTATLADNVCLLLSSTGQTSGSVSYVQF